VTLTAAARLPGPHTPLLMVTVNYLKALLRDRRSGIRTGTPEFPSAQPVTLQDYRAYSHPAAGVRGTTILVAGFVKPISASCQG
jgi:hypothetical protein